MKFTPVVKFYILIASVFLLLYTWGNIQGFKFFKSESGNKWNATENPYGSVHHK